MLPELAGDVYATSVDGCGLGLPKAVPEFEPTESTAEAPGVASLNFHWLLGAVAANALLAEAARNIPTPANRASLPRLSIFFNAVRPISLPSKDESAISCELTNIYIVRIIQVQNRTIEVTRVR